MREVKDESSISLKGFLETGDNSTHFLADSVIDKEISAWSYKGAVLMHRLLVTNEVQARGRARAGGLGILQLE